MRVYGLEVTEEETNLSILVSGRMNIISQRGVIMVANAMIMVEMYDAILEGESFLTERRKY